MNPKYNKFIACWLTNSIDTLFNDKDILLYPVPFGNYQVGNYIDSDEFDNFKKDYEQYTTDHNMKIILHDLSIADGIIYIYDCVFTLDEDIEENLVTIKNNLEFYYGDQFLQNLFEEFFEVDSFPSGLYDIFIDESYIEVEENNTLVLFSSTSI